MNVVMLVGEVTDRPFRPGNGQRTVVKIKTRSATGTPDHFEFDAFGQPGEFGSRLFVGDTIAVTGRLEDRTYTEKGEQVSELRVVAQFIELITRAGDRVPRTTSADSHRDAVGDDRT
jgi:single-stranded DNA-binding protein